MKKVEICILYLATMLSLCVMYATQPIQPLFEQILGISKFQASLFTTSIMVPLAISSILYGYILEKFPIKKILIFAFFMFGVLEFLFAVSNTYKFLIFFRGIQGLIAPAALTGIVSYISANSNSYEVGTRVGNYIGITIIGGFIGRFLSGFFSDIFGWRFMFFLLSALLFITSFLLSKLSESNDIKYLKPNLSSIKDVFFIRHNNKIYIAIFLVFFAFQAILNFIPFHILSIDGNFNGTKTGMIYFGYFLGILISFNIKKIIKIFGGAMFTLNVGIFIFLISAQFLRADDFFVIFCAMNIVCLGNFLAHSIASSTINRLAHLHKPIANGLYFSFYYCGGALGSFVPGFFYSSFSWGVFITFLSVLLIVSIVYIFQLQKRMR